MASTIWDIERCMVDAIDARKKLGLGLARTYDGIDWHGARATGLPFV